MLKFEKKVRRQKVNTSLQPNKHAYITGCFKFLRGYIMDISTHISCRYMISPMPRHFNPLFARISLLTTMEYNCTSDPDSSSASQKTPEFFRAQIITAVFRTVGIIVIIIIKHHELGNNRRKRQQNSFWFQSTQQYIILLKG